MLFIHKHQSVICALFVAFNMATSALAVEPADSARARLQTNQSRLTLSADLTARPGGNYHITKDDKTVEQGSTDAFTKASLGVSYHIYSKGFSRLTASLRYNHLHQHFNSDNRLMDYGFTSSAHHQFAGNIMGMTYLRLWGKPLMVMGTVGCDFSQYGYERWSAIGTAMLMLKQTRQTQFGVGLIGLVNTFSKIPVFPMITYRHTFNPQWTLNLTLPKFQMEYHPSDKDMISLGAGIDADSYYIRPGVDELPDHVRYSRSNINVGPTYEHRFACGLTFSAEAGVQLVMTNRIYRHDSSRELATMHEKAAPFCHISLQQRF
jgi:hypothetical protein